MGLVLVAAGRGTRLGADRPKALVPLGRGRHQAPIVLHALRGALRCTSITHVVVVAPADGDGVREVADAISPVVLDDAPGVHLQVVAGGAERPDSVLLGLRALPHEVGVVLVHDAARALTPVEVFDRVVHAVHVGHAAVTPALPVTDTIKQVTTGPTGVETVVATLDRSSLRAVQTPQGFLRETLERAHAEFDASGGHVDASGRPATGPASATDDCGMVEAHGGRVTVVEGSPRALKITTQHDLALASAWLEEPLTPEPGPALVVLSGLPGVGKTTIARALCRRIGAAHLRVDTVEQGLIRGGLDEGELAAQGYGATLAVARDQLAVGVPVVADMVNGIGVVREAWDEVASATGARLVRVLVECTDPDLHRARVQERVADIEGHRLPTWDEVQERELESWVEADLCVDTAAASTEDIVDRIVGLVQETP